MSIDRDSNPTPIENIEIYADQDFSTVLEQFKANQDWEI